MTVRTLARPTGVPSRTVRDGTRAERWREAAHKAWHRRRRLVLAAYGGRCCECGTAEALELHHLNGIGESEREQRRAQGRTGDDTNYLYGMWRRTRVWPDGYQLLCTGCHRAVHGGKGWRRTPARAGGRGHGGGRRYR